MPRYLTVQPGQHLADFLYHKDPAVLKANGYLGVAIYWKNTDAVQVAKYHAAGLGVLLIHEWSRTDGDTGAAGGTLHGHQARAAADKLGYPADLPMIFANDENTSAATLATHAAHWRAAKAAYGGPAGVYGDRDLMGAIANDGCDLFWHPGSAWSWSGGPGVHHPLTHAVQSGDVHGIGVDDNVVLRPFRMWLGNQATAPVVQAPKHDINKPGTITPVGANVALLQMQCKARGWYPYKVDGIPGPRTAEAIGHLQAACGVKADRWYGAQTEAVWAARLATGH